MSPFLPAFLIGALLALAAPAAAQEDESSEILVTGNREVEEQIRDFVAALTPAPPRGQLSRFERAVCPLAIGLSPSQSEAVARRMRRVAEGAGIAVGGEGCVPNVLLVVTADKAAFIEGVARRHSYYLGGRSPREVRRLAEAPGSAAAWQVQGPPVSARGVELQEDHSSGIIVNRTTTPGSRITAGARPQFAAAMVVVEAGALPGLSTTQLADYAAMRAFARIDPSRLAASQAPTILTVLDAPVGSEVPITLTRWDLAFLRGLYNSPANLRAVSDRSAIRRSMAGELAEESEADTE